MSALQQLRLPIAVSLIVVALSATPLRLLAMIAAVGLWALYWPFSRRINSFVLRLALSFVFVTCFQQLVAIVLWVLHVQDTIPIVVGLELLVFLALVYRQTPRPPVKFIIGADVAALLVSIVSVGAIAFGTLHGGPFMQQMLRFATTGFDNAEHLSLTVSLYDSKEYVYGPAQKELNKVMYPTLSSYPQGWSLSSSLWWHSYSSHLDIRQHPASVLFIYFCTVLFWYGMLLFLLCRLILYLVEILRSKSNNLTGYIGAMLLVGLAEATFIVSLLVFGFASFYPALVFSMALAFLLIELLLEPRNTRTVSSFLIGGLLISAGISFSWLLAAPVAYVMVLMGLLAAFKGSLKQLLQWLWSHRGFSLLGIILIGLAAIQGLVQILYGYKDLINVPGGINPINTLLLFSMLLFTLLAFAYSRSETIKSIFVASMAGALLTSGGVYFYQYLSSGQATYFSTKISYVAVLLLTAFGAAALLGLVQDRLLRKTGQLSGILFVAGLLAFWPIAADITLGTTPTNGMGSVAYVKGTRYLGPDSATRITQLLVSGKGLEGNIIVDRQINYSEDILTSHFLQLFIRHEIAPCISYIGMHQISTWSVDSARVKKCAASTKETFYVIGSEKNYTQLSAQYRNSSDVQVILTR